MFFDYRICSVSDRMLRTAGFPDEREPGNPAGDGNGRTGSGPPSNVKAIYFTGQKSECPLPFWMGRICLPVEQKKKTGKK